MPKPGADHHHALEPRRQPERLHEPLMLAYGTARDVLAELILADLRARIPSA